VLNSEKESDYASDPEMADHVWGGNYEIVSEASYYARLIAEAERQGRIGDFPQEARLATARLENPAGKGANLRR
jgi:phage terminase large subunit